MNTEQNTPDHTPLVKRSWVERNGFSDWALAMIWIVVAFVLFQATASVVSIALIILTDGIQPDMDFLELVSRRLDLLFIGNSTGQILFLGLATLLIARLHVPKEGRKAFLNLRVFSNTGRITALTAVLFIVVQPVIWYIGFLNSLVPVPDYFSDIQQAQYEMIENFLRSDGAVLLGLIHIALVPAVCEEVMFRGYVQSAFQKSWGVWPAILVSGFVFGLFHLQLTNILPLASLGILLALVTWISGSLIPAIVAHFINNGSAVLLANYFPEMAFAEMTAETAPPIWALLISIVLTFVVIRQLFAGRLSDETDRI